MPRIETRLFFLFADIHMILSNQGQKFDGLSAFLKSDFLFYFFEKHFNSASFNAQALDELQCKSLAPERCALSEATFSILCATVPVNTTIISGLPICLLKFAGHCVKTLHLHPYFLHISLYWQCILSCPPTITTLIKSSVYNYFLP